MGISQSELHKLSVAQQGEPKTLLYQNAEGVHQYENV